MIHGLQSLLPRNVLASIAAMTLAVIGIVASMVLLSPAEAGLPNTALNQSVNSHNSDVIFHHGIHAWHESGHDGMTSTGTRLEIGIIDAGFDGWRMSAR